MIERYFDNAATTPVDPRVVEEMLPYFSEAFGNPNSIHEPGRKAHAAIELARQRVAALIEAEDPSQLVFTSGATEANNWVLKGFSSEGGLVGPFEHSSIREPAIHFGYTTLANEGPEIRSPLITSGLVSLMTVNNETGGQADPRNLILANGVTIHADITQQVGKLPTHVFGLSFASFSAHKFFGPKGVGALYSASSYLDPLILGGEQESGQRAGTLNVPGIVGMGAAAAIALQEADNNKRHAESLRALVLDEITKTSDIQLNSPANSSPYIVSLSFLGVEGETLVVELDRAGYSISSGAACSSRSTEPSHVLTALGLPIEWIRGTIRISFGKYNTEEAAINLAKELRKAVEKLRTMN